MREDLVDFFLPVVSYNLVDEARESPATLPISGLWPMDTGHDRTWSEELTKKVDTSLPVDEMGRLNLSEGNAGEVTRSML